MIKYLIFLMIVLVSCTMNMNEGHTVTKGDHTGNSLLIQSKEYVVQLDADRLESGKLSLLNIIVLNAQTKGPITDLEIDHQKKLHVFFTNNNLEQFLHLHSKNDNNGIFEVESMFPSGGKWLMVVEWKHKGQLFYQTQELDIEGTIEKTIAKNYSLEKTNNGYSVELASNQISRGKISLDFFLKYKNDLIIDSLQDYLGAPMHIVIWSEDKSFFTHAHAQIIGERVSANVNLPKEGNYKVWVQFKHNDEVHTFDYWIKN